MIPERNRAIVREFRDVLERGSTDTKGMRRTPLIGKAIVFAVTKRHAETLAQMLDSAYADKKPSPEIRYVDYVVSGMGSDDTVDGITKIKRFKKEEFRKPIGRSMVCRRLSSGFGYSSSGSFTCVNTSIVRCPMHQK